MIPVAVPLLTARERLDARRLIESRGLAFEDGADEIVGIYDTPVSAIGRSATGRPAGTQDTQTPQDTHVPRSQDAGPHLVAMAARAGYVLKMFAVDDATRAARRSASWHGPDSLGRAAGHEALFVFTRPEHAASFETAEFRLLVTTARWPCWSTAAASSATSTTARRLRRAGRQRRGRRQREPVHPAATSTSSRPRPRAWTRSTSSSSARTGRCSPSRCASGWPRRPPRTCRTSSCSTRRATPSAPATFPSYFLRAASTTRRREQMQIDVRLFGAHLAPAFAIRDAVRRPRAVLRRRRRPTTARWPTCCRSTGSGWSEVDATRPTAGRFISATDVRAALAPGTSTRSRAWCRRPHWRSSARPRDGRSPGR